MYYIITYGSEVWNRGMEQRYGTDPSRRYGTGVWNGGMERVWSRSLFRTSYFDLPPYILHQVLIDYIYTNAAVIVSMQHIATHRWLAMNTVKETSKFRWYGGYGGTVHHKIIEFTQFNGGLMGYYGGLIGSNGNLNG